jgi:Ras association domain-containing protein 2/4
MSVYVTTMLTAQEIVSLVMDKYKIESKADNFALFVVRDNGEQKKLSNDDCPLLTRVLLGPHEDVARLFLMDTDVTHEIRLNLNSMIYEKMKKVCNTFNFLFILK